MTPLQADLLAASGMRFTPISTGGNCTALAATTESHHEILVTDGDGGIPPQTSGRVRVSAYAPDSPDIVATESAECAPAAAVVLDVLARIPSHVDHYDDEGVVYCDRCTHADFGWQSALGLI